MLEFIFFHNDLFFLLSLSLLLRRLLALQDLAALVGRLEHAGGHQMEQP